MVAQWSYPSRVRAPSRESDPVSERAAPMVTVSFGFAAASAERAWPAVSRRSPASTPTRLRTAMRVQFCLMRVDWSLMTTNDRLEFSRRRFLGIAGGLLGAAMVPRQLRLPGAWAAPPVQAEGSVFT